MIGVDAFGGGQRRRNDGTVAMEHRIGVMEPGKLTPQDGQLGIELFFDILKQLVDVALVRNTL